MKQLVVYRNWLDSVGPVDLQNEQNLKIDYSDLKKAKNYVQLGTAPKSFLRYIATRKDLLVGVRTIVKQAKFSRQQFLRYRQSLSKIYSKISAAWLNLLLNTE